MKKSEMIDWLIGNSASWDEADRPTLEKFGEDKLKSFVDSETLVAEAVELGETVQQIVGNTDLTLNEMPAALKAKVGMKKEKEVKTDEEGTEKEMKKPACNESKSAADWYADAPPEVQRMIKNADRVEKQAKADIIGRLTSNLEGDRKAAAEKVYAGMDLDALEAIAPPKRTDDRRDDDNPFGGGTVNQYRYDLGMNADYGPTAAGGNPVTTNKTGKDGKAETYTPLQVPVFNFDADDAKAK